MSSSDGDRPLKSNPDGSQSGLGLATPEGYRFADDDSAWEMATETKKLANKYVSDKRYADAIQRYSEVIMQARELKPGTVDNGGCGKSFREIRELVQSCYLNLSMCFLKSEQWGHA